MERIGRYEIVDELGRGAMGVVYRARDPKIGREVAIKTIKLADKADSSEIESLKERLLREAQSAGRLSHPGIVTIYDVDEQDDIAYIAMELIEGKSLDQILSDGPVKDLSRFADIMQQAAAALDYAHDKGIIHRDVKPGNLMLTANGSVKIMDFGIARVGSAKLTQTGTVMGTPSYMSPEQVKGDELDGRSDQFSLAVIAYEMLTGKKPFGGDNLTSVIFKIVSTEPAPVRELASWVSPELAAVIERAMSKDREARYPDCGAFAGELTEAATGESTGDFPAPSENEQTRGLDTGSYRTEASAGGALDATLDNISSDTGRQAAAGLPPLKRREAPPEPLQEQPSEDSSDLRKKIAIGVAAALLIAVVSFAMLVPGALENPFQALGNTFALVTGAEPEADFEPAEDAVELKYDAPEAPPVPEPEATEPESEPATVAESTPAPEPEPEAPAPQASQPAPAKAAPPEQAARTEPAPQAARPKATPRPAAPKVETVSVYFRTDPRNARIQVDNRPDWNCETPCRLNLPAGGRQVTAKLAGYHTATRYLDLGAREQEVIDIKLEDARIFTLITSEPTGGDIYIDGRRTGQKTNAKVPLPRGTYQIKVVKEGVGEAEQVVVVDKDQIPYAKFVLGQKQ